MGLPKIDQMVQGYLGAATRDLAWLIAERNIDLVGALNVKSTIAADLLREKLRIIQDRIIAAAALL